MSQLWLSRLVVLTVCTSVCAADANANDCTKPIPDASRATPIGYYGDTNGLTGSELKQHLNDVVDGHTRHSWQCVWTILKEADEHPDDADSVMAFYRRIPVRKSQRTERVRKGDEPGDTWNREHVWPKSRGFPHETDYPFTDVHHLRAADYSVNSSKGTKHFDSGGSKHQECDCRYTTTTWEPPLSVRGDVARMVFYIDVRYENDGDDGHDTDLALDTGSGKATLGNLTTLLEWHRDDPVSTEERARNDTVHQWQDNRNPFVDHPEFADLIYGTVERPTSVDAQSEVDPLRVLAADPLR